MPALNFQKQFAAAVESGKKRQTIRAYRKDGRDVKAGDTLYLYTGMRTKGCRKLGEVACDETAPFSIDGERGAVWENAEMRVGNRPVLMDEFAESDGFKSAATMLEWFEENHGLPFEGMLIKWGKLTS